MSVNTIGGTVRKKLKLTATGAGKFDKAQERIVTLSHPRISHRQYGKEENDAGNHYRDRLESDVAVPLEATGLGLVGALPVQREALVQLAVLHARDDAYLVVLAALVAPGVDDGVNVQARRRRLARQLPEPLHQLLL